MFRFTPPLSISIADWQTVSASSSVFESETTNFIIVVAENAIPPPSPLRPYNY